MTSPRASAIADGTTRKAIRRSPERAGRTARPRLAPETRAISGSSEAEIDMPKRLTGRSPPLRVGEPATALSAGLPAPDRRGADLDDAAATTTRPKRNTRRTCAEAPVSDKRNHPAGEHRRELDGELEGEPTSPRRRRFREVIRAVRPPNASMARTIVASTPPARRATGKHRRWLLRCRGTTTRAQRPPGKQDADDLNGDGALLAREAGRDT
jgi:hypothetical protein